MVKFCRSLRSFDNKLLSCGTALCFLTYTLVNICIFTIFTIYTLHFTDDEAVWGTAFEFFGKGEEGKRACRAIGALAAVGQIDATITNFLVPLQVCIEKKECAVFLIVVIICVFWCSCIALR